ncbi:hypothetical protein OIU74_003741 [Salix koriyanagi]|uniref:Uncharacterized protein n=1 Tax=Salix koriyanagi TaxID=2511006 RepID=A0A9Q0UYG5_9ROSI|nr:hypothetical protein OIU74_003741 [Salix koriyanagi]
MVCDNLDRIFCGSARLASFEDYALLLFSQLSSSFSKTPPLDEDLSFLEEETDAVPHDHGNGHDHYPDPDQFDEELDNEDDIENYSDLNDSELDSYKELEREREKEKSLRKKLEVLVAEE